ncbi:uncharacterized protein RCO7_05150 [Rhynchosporium graminicola]|uniref:Uncharacterized protein n=1 Tax=Rhynchosporium graminicola TaxID=2792576 RepID=A0A1E1L6D6_9HELO|nr:uncharacterized protein RCO7_05150 [Rhynchosporium commune]
MSSITSKVEEHQDRNDVIHSEDKEEVSEGDQNPDLWETASDAALRARQVAHLSKSSQEGVETAAQPEVEDGSPSLSVNDVPDEEIEESDSVVAYNEWFARLAEQEEETFGELLIDFGDASEPDIEDNETNAEDLENSQDSYESLIHEEQEAASDHLVNDEGQIHKGARSISTLEAVDRQFENTPLPSGSENILQNNWSEFEDLISPRDLEFLSNTEAHSSTPDYAEQVAAFFHNEDQVDAEAIQEKWLDKAATSSQELSQSNHAETQSVSPDHSHVSEHHSNHEAPLVNFAAYHQDESPESEETTFQPGPNHYSHNGAENSQGECEYQQQVELSQGGIQFFLNQMEAQANQNENRSQQQVENPEAEDFEEQHFQQYSEFEQEHDLQQYSSTPSNQADSTNFIAGDIITIEDDDATIFEDEGPGPTVEERILEIKSKIARSRARTAAKLAKIAENKKTIRKMAANLKRQRSDVLEESEDGPAKKAKTLMYRRPSTRKEAKPHASNSNSNSKASKVSKIEQLSHVQRDDAPANSSRSSRVSANAIKESFARDAEAEAGHDYSPYDPASALMSAPNYPPVNQHQLDNSTTARSYDQASYMGPTAYGLNPYLQNGFVQTPEKGRRFHQSELTRNYGPPTPQHRAYPRYQPSYTSNSTHQYKQPATMQSYLPEMNVQNTYPSTMNSYAHDTSNGFNPSSSTNGYQQHSSHPGAYMRNMYPSSGQGYPYIMDNQRQFMQSMLMNGPSGVPLMNDFPLMSDFPLMNSSHTSLNSHSNRYQNPSLSQTNNRNNNHHSCPPSALAQPGYSPYRFDNSLYGAPDMRRTRK